MSSEEKLFIKWVVILCVSAVLAVITVIVVTVYCPRNHTVKVDEPMPMPKSMVFTSASDTTSVKVRANVEPYNAENTKVDYLVAWKDAPSSYTENVSEYVTVRQDGDGSLTATITCIKPFTQYNVVITVTTRDGGYTAQCLCTFSGKATAIELSVDGKELTTDNARGTYYLLDSKKTSTVRIHATNAYDYVPNARYTVTVNIPEVELWFGDCTYGEYGETYFSRVWSERLQIRYNAGKLFSVGSVSDGTFTITTKKAMEYGAEIDETETDEYGFVHRYGKDACIYDPYCMGVGSTNGVENIQGKNESNIAIIDRLCYEIVVTEQNSGISEVLRFWVNV